LIIHYPDGTYHQDGVAIAFFQPSTTNGTSSNKFRELKSGKISWAEITREDKQLVEAEKKVFRVT
jgi:hypothetical protein